MDCYTKTEKCMARENVMTSRWKEMYFDYKCRFSFDEGNTVKVKEHSKEACRSPEKREISM